LIILVGIQLFVSGIIADIAVRNYFSQSNQKPYLIKDIDER